MKATGDPHMINVHGQRFDILHPGSYVLISIPRLPTRKHAKHALLVVDASVRQFGGACSEMYIQTLNISGKWVDESTRVNDAAGTGRTILQYRAGEMEGRRATSWQQFGGVDVKVGGGRTQQGVDYLNFFVRHLGRVGHSVGGLLGEDDHMAVAKPSASCIKVTNLDVRGMANRNVQTAASAMAAPADADAEGAPPGSVAEVTSE